MLVMKDIFACPYLTICWYANIVEKLSNYVVYNIRGCHTPLVPFSEVGEWGGGSMSLNGGGSIIGEWKP